MGRQAFILIVALLDVAVIGFAIVTFVYDAFTSIAVPPFSGADGGDITVECLISLDEMSVIGPQS